MAAAQPLERTSLPSITHYQALNIFKVPETVTYEDISSAFHRLQREKGTHYFAKVWPNEGWISCFEKAEESYDVLKNPQKRRIYDRSIGIKDHDGQLKEGRRVTDCKILGVTHGASNEQITKAFRAKAKQIHPDKVVGREQKEVATQKFKEVQPAYERLMENSKKELLEKMAALKPNYWRLEIPCLVVVGCSTLPSLTSVPDVVDQATASSSYSEEFLTVASYSAIISFSALCFLLAAYLYYHQRKICEQAQTEGETSAALADNEVEKNLSHVFRRHVAKWSCVGSLITALCLYSDGAGGSINQLNATTLSSLANPSVTFAHIFLLLSLIALGMYVYHRYQVGPVLEVRSEAQQLTETETPPTSPTPQASSNPVMRLTAA